MSSQPMDSYMHQWLQPVADIFSRSKRPEIKKLIMARRWHDDAGAASADPDAFRALVEENVKATVKHLRKESLLSIAYDKRNKNPALQFKVFVHGFVLDEETGEVKDLGVSFGPPGQIIPEVPFEVIVEPTIHNSFGKFKPKAKKLDPTSTSAGVTSTKKEPSSTRLMHLSEKAKGKQRAVEPPRSGDTPAQPDSLPEESRDLVIRFTEGYPDLVVDVGQQDTVRDVKRKIREERPELNDRRLRLIHSGRLLTEGTFLYSWLASLEERQKRAAPDDSNNSSQSQPSSVITWMHCSVGPKLEPGEPEEGTTQTAQLQPARGFDRLASVGFSEADIANFRRQFHSQSSSNYLDIDFETEEEYDEHARALEEQWIDSIDNAGTASLSQSSPSNITVLQGILLGFFFPLIPFFFMRNSKPAVFWDDGSEYEPPGNVVFS
ncbi:hypothetical protein H0H87_004149 [Tephrocybe sp. NHM501043]|nr:hypothetical protein H0H87_004149 [Tephrocybe sp. NHM501043]